MDFPLKEAGERLLAEEVQELRRDILRSSGEIATATGSGGDYIIAVDDNDGGSGQDLAPIDSLVDGQIFIVRANHANDGDTTLKVNDFTAYPILSRGSQLPATMIGEDDIFVVRWDEDNTVFQLMGAGPVKASDADAIAGTNDDRFMTPAKTKLSILANRGRSMQAGENIVISSDPKAVFIARSAGDAATDAVTVISQNSSNTTFNCWGVNWCKQSFTAETDMITSIRIYGFRQGTVGGNFTIDVYAADGSDNPTGSILATINTPGASISTSNDTYTYTFSSPLAVTKGNKYVIVMSATGGTSNSNDINIGIRSGGSLYAGGIWGTSSDSGSSWSNAPTTDMRFDMIGYDTFEVGKIYLSDISGPTEQRKQFDGFVLEDIDNNDFGLIYLDNDVSGFTGLTIGSDYSIGTDGAVVAGYGYGYCGVAVASDTIEINQRLPQLIAVKEIQATGSVAAGTVLVTAPVSTRKIVYSGYDAAANIGVLAVPNVTLNADNEGTYQQEFINRTSSGVWGLRYTKATREVTTTQLSGSTANSSVGAGMFRFYR